MLDLVKPDDENKIRLRDLKRCKLTNVFFDTFFNLEKYLDNEQKDPFSNIKVTFNHIKKTNNLYIHRIRNHLKYLIGLNLLKLNMII
jgi:hypothetical protein